MNIKSIAAAMFAAAFTLGFASCKKTPVVTESISVNPETLAFAAEGGESTVSVISPGGWHVSSTSGAWITLDVTESKYSSTVKVSVGENTVADTPRNGSVTFTNGKKNAVLAISQEGASRPLPNEIYAADFTKGFGDFTVEDKTKPSELEKIWIFDETSATTKGYGLQASGHSDANNANYDVESWLISPEIDLAGYKIAYFSFTHVANKGVGDLHEQLKVAVISGSTTKMIDSDYILYSSGYSWNDWTNSGDIDLSAYCGKKVKLAFIYTSSPASSYKWEIKNVRVFRDPKDNGRSYTTVPSWMELPEIKDADKGNLVIHTSFEDDLGYYLRNYSMLNLPQHGIAQWVAYPMSNLYRGSLSRSDSWAADPMLSKDYQANVTSGGQYEFSKNNYDRGHQIPSADRQKSEFMNSQTFYYSNVTPQIHEFNSGIWEKLETRVRTGWGMVATTDTLYVVTGATVDAKPQTVKDHDGKPISIPSGYFKAILKYTKNDAKPYIGCAFWFEHKKYSVNTVADLKEFVISIDELEKITGINFFPRLEDVIGKDEAAKVEAENPLENNYWWK